MKKILLIALVIFFGDSLYSQNLYPEKYEGCHLSNFCLDCGDTKANPPKSILDELKENFDKKIISELKGTIEVQILIDENGKPCLLSSINKTNIPSKKLNLPKVFNNVSAWKPAISKNKPQNSSVSFVFEFNDGDFSMRRRILDFKNQTNMKSVGTPAVKGSDKDQLTKNWIVYKKQNSELPWDMTRAVANDLENNIWIGTDNGIVEIQNNKWRHFNSENTIISPTPYDKSKTQSVRDIEIDKQNNKWFLIGWDAYKYDNNNWTKYDSINSPISWARQLFVDHSNNVWFTSSKGVAKFDGKTWTKIDKQNSNLPSDKISGVYVDNKNRIWIGTSEGNVIIENGSTKLLDQKNSPLAKAFISKMYEDKKGNLWFCLEKNKSSDAGIYRLDVSGKWTRISHSDSKMFSENTVNDFYLDENNDFLWLTLNGVGVLKYDLNLKKWEIYTNENSNVPSIHSTKITKDKDGAIWIATYAGVIKTE
ncbi:ligand-binding sensor domain-containing protein [Flavobacterium foetidum]|uniref:ligand-binding sensor domain-containing protein n=1 Tax=Flavobacterium foetidum TaxID=2026681 RepID=UPI0010757C05|nr:two-component regulator propeller domain-containing protein [Flavobacterium foetidum]KAF2517374.1 hypothetical protein E0W73_04560 [Flavobacterium foetidum]